MKIAVLGTRGFPDIQGGVESHCENLYTRLAKMGCDVTVFGRKPYLKIGTVPTSMQTTVRGQPLFYKDVTLIAISCPTNKFLEALVHTFKGVFAARKLKPDILHIHAVGPSLLVPFARLMGFKVVMTNHGPDYARKKWNWFAKLILWKGEWLGSVFSNAVICISETIASDIRRRFHREVTVIPNGVDTPEIVRTDEALKKYGLEKGKYLLAVGRFVPEKGLHDLVEAFGIASAPAGPRNDGWKLVIAGDADHEDKYSLSLKQKVKTNPSIISTGFISGVPLKELYSNAGLFVLPSYYEGLPIVLLEAMSYGLSCIVSDIPANREVELSEDRFFKPGDVKKLSEKIKEFIGRSMTDEAKEKQINMIKDKYNWESIAIRTLDIYKEALGS